MGGGRGVFGVLRVQLQGHEAARAPFISELGRFGKGARLGKLLRALMAVAVGAGCAAEGKGVPHGLCRVGAGRGKRDGGE